MVEVSTGAPKRKEQNVMVRTGNCEDEVTTNKRLHSRYIVLLSKGATTVLKLGGPSAEGASRGAEEGEAWEGVSPSPLEEGSREGARPLPQKMF